MKKRAIISLSLVLFFLAVIPNAYGQETYNFYTLEYFKKSLECLVVGEYDNAILNSSNVIRRDPNSSVAYTIRGRAYFEKGDMNNAINDCTQAIRLDKNNISAFSIRANAYVRTGNLTRAITDWEAMLRINPENTEARQNIETARSQMASL